MKEIQSDASKRIPKNFLTGGAGWILIGTWRRRQELNLCRQGSTDSRAAQLWVQKDWLWMGQLRRWSRSGSQR